MGTPMCAALAKAGYEVTATDKRAEREPAALACGAEWRQTPAQAAAAAGVLRSMLPGPRAVPAALQDALAGSAAASRFIRRDLGLVFHGDYLASFGLDRICEELDAVTALAGEHQAPWELSEVVRRTYHRALARFGPAEGELLA